MSVVDISKMTFDNAEVVPSGAGIPSERNLDVVAFEINIIKEQRLDSMLRHVVGAEKGADLASADLSAGAYNYLKAAGMTDEQIDQLTAYLCA